MTTFKSRQDAINVLYNCLMMAVPGPDDPRTEEERMRVGRIVLAPAMSALLDLGINMEELSTATDAFVINAGLLSQGN